MDKDTQEIYLCGILTISDKGSRGERQDTSGPQLQEQLRSAGSYTISKYAIVADDPIAITATLKNWCDNEGLDLILTTGGTGVSPSDQTPETTLPLLDKVIPGISEMMRMASFQKTANAILSRGVAGIRKSCLIINLPGSERAARENLETILPGLAHALYKIKGGSKDCGS
ncbi:MAG: MogA/MoaB family molybdenum cofactor biosynthesis protein [Proteobacteria bacterium]|nr:MogA/MoaB family molybdenum cofactor biosynthesis protein [Pseudomonadota bacterium]MBU1640211.1 MogA/MoaB family molybdenum cofactor biosynthesis protein [Pseudomonadota bacterium]